MIAESAYRVLEQTDARVNERIHRDTDRRIAYFRSRPHEISQRLRELDQEWDIERMLETASSGLSLSGVILGIGISRKWLLLPLAVQGFMMMHALQGWCPPLPMLRRLGFRTVYEIEEERAALKSLQIGEPYGVDEAELD
jgi:hypothetical protein